MFQSAPGFYPRRNRDALIAGAGINGFNPLPGSIPGETSDPCQRFAEVIVSIRSRVLSQEKRRMAHQSVGFMAFQSAPGFYPRRNSAAPRAASVPASFNPLPGSIPGETITHGHWVSIADVSIRSRVLSQEKRAPGNIGAAAFLFQSAPGFYPRRNRPSGRCNGTCNTFQSAPGFYPRRNPTSANPFVIKPLHYHLRGVRAYQSATTRNNLRFCGEVQSYQAHPTAAKSPAFSRSL